MTKITLDNIIEEQQERDPEFTKHYQKELLINAISKMVVTLRKARDFTQTELAEKAKTTQPVIARLESGEDSRLPSLQLLERIAEASNSKLNVNFELRDNNE